MSRKGIWSVCFSPRASSSSSFSPPCNSRFNFSPSPSPTLSHSAMDRIVQMADLVIMKWNSQTIARATSLFSQNRREACDFIETVNNLHKAMHFLVGENPSSDKMIRAQDLMPIAMKRLQFEFYQILSVNRVHLHPDSVSITDDSLLAMADLRSIAECMISCGYAAECLKIYKIIRKSVVDEGVYRLGVEELSSSEIRKMDWEAVDLRINNWLSALPTAVKTLFKGERILCDHVFASSESVREWCFAEITKEGAAILFSFPENLAKHSKMSPEKVFRVMDMYAGISNNWPEIDSVFSGLHIKSYALTSLIELRDFVRANFESVIQKDSVVAGAGVHTPAMNVGDYTSILTDILADSTLSRIRTGGDCPASIYCN